MRLLLVLLMLLCGCHKHSYTITPGGSMPVKSEKLSVVCVTKDGYCEPCERQKDVLDRMQRDGLLTVKYIKGGSEQYPASVYPTLYICEGGRCYPAQQGYMSKESILRYVQ